MAGRAGHPGLTADQATALARAVLGARAAERIGEAITEWVAYRAERRLPPWRERTWRAQFSRAARDPDGWAEAVAESIAQQWQGVFLRARFGLRREARDVQRDLGDFLRGTGDGR